MNTYRRETTNFAKPINLYPSSKSASVLPLSYCSHEALNQLSMGNNQVKVGLRSRITCPHCWHGFAPEDSLWVSQHPDLLNDPCLGPDAQQRFLPTRFTAEGHAIDSRNSVCQQLACPECHLAIPRAMYEMAPVFLSIAGTPSCGKSCFLASLTWKLRQVLPAQFSVSFSDVDPVSNAILNHYEEIQFFNPNRDEVVKLPKTEEQGDLYDSVRHGNRVVSYPRPFFFGIRPLPTHPSAAIADRVSRVLCLYDNAGESFQPGKDTVANPVTRHLARSQVLFFLYDPTQDPRIREACRPYTSDFQVTAPSVSSRQETVLHEIVDRVRRHARIGQNERHNRPLVVIVTKYDAWSSLLPEVRLQDPWTKARDRDWNALNVEMILQVSKQVRSLLWKFTPELVSTAEAFSKEVVFVPVSATGRSPESDPTSGKIGVKPRDICPIWVEVPLLVALSRWCGGLVPFITARKEPLTTGGAKATAEPKPPNSRSAGAQSHFEPASRGEASKPPPK